MQLTIIQGERMRKYTYKFSTSNTPTFKMLLVLEQTIRQNTNKQNTIKSFKVITLHELQFQPMHNYLTSIPIKMEQQGMHILTLEIIQLSQ